VRLSDVRTGAVVREATVGGAVNQMTLSKSRDVVVAHGNAVSILAADSFAARAASDARRLAEKAKFDLKRPALSADLRGGVVLVGTDPWLFLIDVTTGGESWGAGGALTAQPL
jgi:hypothetical protein